VLPVVFSLKTNRGFSMSLNNSAKRHNRPHRRGQYSPGRLRAYRGKHLSAELLVRHLTGSAPASGASAVAGQSSDGAGAGPVASASSVLPGRMVLLIGLPASGKSTISSAFEKAGWVRLNKDSLRKELYGDESVAGNLREVSGLFYRRLEEALQNGRNVLIDNTNVSPLHRKGPLATALVHGYTRITHVFLDVPVEECLRRNSLRDRKVPEAAIRELAEALTWKGGVPTRSEGHLVVLKPGSNPSDFLVDRVRLHGKRRVKIRHDSKS
jgi:predicted kinase